MDYLNHNFSAINIDVCAAIFQAPGERQETHVMLQPGVRFSGFSDQLQHLSRALTLTMEMLQCKQQTDQPVIVLKRYFISDAANQQEELQAAETSQNNLL